MKTMKSIYLFIAILASLALVSKGWENDLDVLHSFRLNITNTFRCPNDTACANPQKFNWTIKLGGVPASICQERCALLFYVNFGSHNASSTPGSVFKASNYTTARDLYRFFDLLNNFYPYVLGYQIEWLYGAFGSFGGIGIANLTTQTISDIDMTINKISVKNSTTRGSYEVHFDLSFAILGHAHPNLTNTTELTVGDSFVRNDTSRNINYGKLPYLDIHDKFGLPNETSTTYLAFTLLNYTSLNKATLRLYGGVTTNGSLNALAYSVNGTFNESTITWQNAPRIWQPASLFDTFIYPNQTWYEFDITPMVREQFPYGGGTLYMAVVGLYGSSLARFSSREGAHIPQLVLYAVLPDSQESPQNITGNPPSNQLTPQAQNQPQSNNQPQRQPTAQPHSQPTNQPQTQPQTQPHSQPTNQPIAPPQNITNNPPSNQLTPQAQNQPQSNNQPQNQPHAQPTTQPQTTQPTNQPQNQPQNQPHNQPTNQPNQSSNNFASDANRFGVFTFLSLIGVIPLLALVV